MLSNYSVLSPRLVKPPGRVDRMGKAGKPRFHPRRQLEQHDERWGVRAELEQRADEHEQQHWVPGRQELWLHIHRQNCVGSKNGSALRQLVACIEDLPLAFVQTGLPVKYGEPGRVTGITALFPASGAGIFGAYHG